jgi:hypothetical protein
MRYDENDELIFKHKTISEMISNLHSDFEKLNDVPQISAEYRDMIHDISRKSCNIFDMSTNLCYNIKEKLRMNCTHDYVVDRSSADICRTWKICRKCGDMI